MSKHTQGPWQATENAYGCHFVQRTGHGKPHGLICGGNSHETLTKSNARLIAAAPDLLDALKMCVTERSEWLAEAHAAIAKAEGGEA